jgi:hypothetical protein
MTGSPWEFGWNQVLTLAGLVLTTGIAFGGFRSFDRWKREQLETKKIDIAFETLSVVYQAKWVFGNIRSPLIEDYEWSEMKPRPGDTDDIRRKRGPSYAILERIRSNQDFFKAVWQIQPKCSAAFGREVEQIFLELHKARRKIEVAAQMLAAHADDAPLTPDPSAGLWRQLRADMCGDEAEFAPEEDRVGKHLAAFEAGLEAICRPKIVRSGA